MTRRVIERFMLIGLLCSLGFLAYAVFFYSPEIQGPHAGPMMKMGLNIEDLDHLLSEEKTFHSAAGSKRNLFAFASDQEPVVAMLPQTDLPQNYQVVGLIFAHPSSEVLIEDKQNQQTLFLAEGEHQGDLLIERIEQDRVFGFFKNQRFEVVVNEDGEFVSAQ